MKLVGYTDKLSAKGGETVEVMISSEHPTFHAKLVRLIHGDERSAGPGFKSKSVPSSFEGQYPGTHQRIMPGSYARIPSRRSLHIRGSFSIQMWIMPTTPKSHTQTLLSAANPDGDRIALRLEKGQIALSIGDQTVHTERSLHRGVWYSVSAAYSADSGIVRLRVHQHSGIVLADPESVTAQIVVSPIDVTGDILFAGEAIEFGSTPTVGNFYNGKIDSPRIFTRALDDTELVALEADEAPADPAGSWDFSLDISSSIVSDTSRHKNHGVVVNRPTRAVTGRNWDASTTSWTDVPHEYAAIHFHDDDLSDAGWTPSFSWSVPEDLQSGVYAVHVTSGNDEDYIPFIIVPHIDRAQADIAVVMPTFSYLAYANEQMANGGTLNGLVENYPRLPEDAYIVNNRLISLYDCHSDGSSVAYASWLRPLVNMRPKYTQHWLHGGKGAPHQLGADLYLIDWLVQNAYSFDVITDLELHYDGLARLQPYRVVLTGTHAEYTSGAMIDAYQDYLNGGGRLLYLSGNWMFWVTEPDSDTGTGVEIRRRGSSEWTWPAAPGEAHLSNTGELGGQWATRGRSSHKWLGVGTCGEGDGPGRPFKRNEDSYDPRVRFVFEGIADDELIGDFPSLVNGWGVAGYEVDYADPKKMPEHALVLATADGFGSAYAITSTTLEGGAAQGLEMQTDLVFLEYPNDGAVFSFSCISWAASLSYNNYDNNVARLTQNVLNGFLVEGRPPWLIGAKDFELQGTDAW